jgi:cysteine synthase A
MPGILNNVSELVGNTPMLRLANFAASRNLNAVLLAKLEYYNPTGSIKDRIALALIEDAEKCGRLKRGAVIIEPTSGNTGIGLASVAASKGYRIILTMPESMSVERRRLLAAYGAELVLTGGEEGMKGAIAEAVELAARIEGAFMPGQFDNPKNPETHRLSTGPEIWEDTGGDVDILVAGVGTGGTITGAGEYLKEKDPNIKITAVEPFDSPFLSEGRGGAHQLQGIGAGFIPKILNLNVCDEIIKVKTEEAYESVREIAKSEGLLLGVSSGAAAYAAVCVAKRAENFGKKIVVIMPDGGERYLSTPLFDNIGRE